MSALACVCSLSRVLRTLTAHASRKHNQATDTQAPVTVASSTCYVAVPFSLRALCLQRVFSGFLLICGLALIRCSLHLLQGGDAEPLAHRAFLEGVPDAAFHATYAGQLLGLFLAYKVAQVSSALCCTWYVMCLVNSSKYSVSL